MPCLYHSLEREWEDLVHSSSTQALGSDIEIALGSDIDVSDIEMEEKSDY